MFELTINSRVYQFNFGIGFLRDIEPTVTKPIDGIKGKVQNMGLQYAIGGVMDCNIIDIADVLLRANKGFEPRLTQAEVEGFLESGCTDIEALSEQILGFLKTANATKKATLNLIEAVEKEKAKEAAKENA
jgi:hypothetical protein